MNDTAMKLLALADEYRNAGPYPFNASKAARKALQDELTRLFTPLTQTDVVDGFCKQPHDVQFVSVFNAGARFAESMHGITGEKNEIA